MLHLSSSARTSAVHAWSRTLTGPSPIISEADLVAFEALFSALPCRGASYYAELRLAGAQQLDLLLSLDAFVGPPLLRAIEHRQVGWQGAACEAWSHAHRFLGDWMDSSSAIRHLVSAVWFEFDDVRRAHAEVAPSLSACLVRDYRLTRSPVDGAPATEQAAALTTVYRAIAGERYEAEVIRDLIACALALPGDGRIIHLSVMTARTPQATKLYLVLPRGEVAPYLRRVGWSGSFDLLRSWLNASMPFALCGDQVFLDLNLENHRDPLRASLGLAFAQQQALADPTRAHVLQRLVQVTQCSAAAASSLATWPGSPCQAPNLRRWLDLKLVLGGGDRVFTKAYLGFVQGGGPFSRTA